MKRLGVAILAVSLVANFVLIVVQASSRPTRAGETTGSHEGDHATREGKAATPVEGASSSDSTGARHGVIADWREIESPDLAVVRDRLRAAGFPEEYVRAVIRNRIQKRLLPDRLALAQRRGSTPYWMPPDRASDAALRAAERELDRAMRDEFKTYFDEPLGEVARSRQERERLAFLPGDKVDAVTQVDSDYSELKGQIRDEMYSGIPFDEDREKLAMLEQERRADLAAILTPEELELYELNTSSTANSMRSRLAHFEPSEAEFRAIYSLQRTYDDEFGSMYGPLSSEAVKQRSDAQTRLNEEIASVLGPERSADYQRATNPSYQAAMKIASHYGRPPENAATVYSLEQEYQRRAREAMQAGGDRQKAAALAQTLAAEAAERVVELLGEEGAKAFRESGGSWLHNLEQQAQRAAAARP